MPRSVCFVIPTLDEEEAIGPTMDTVPVEELQAAGYEVDILIVDGDSEDRTREIAREKGARVIVESRPGYGRAYKTGFAETDADIIITGDADTTYPFELSPTLIEQLEEEDWDFITTNRLAGMEEGAMGPKHKLGNWVLTTGCRLLFRTSFEDSQSGMWVFRSSVLEEIELTDDGMPMSEEIKIEAFGHPEVQATEVPIPYRSRIGEVKLDSWNDGFRNLAFLFKKRFGGT